MGKINVYDRQNRDLKPEQKIYKIWESKEFLHKSPINIWFRNGIHSLLKRAYVIGSVDIIYRI